MATKVESWKAEDGTLHPTELTCVRYEVLNRLFKELPQLKVCRDVFSEDSEVICEILAPLVAAHAKDHPEVPEKTTLKPSSKPRWGVCAAIQHSDQVVCNECDQTWDVNDPAPPPCHRKDAVRCHPKSFKRVLPIDHGELAGLCDCSAGMSGSDDHSQTCPAFRPKFRTGGLVNG